MSQYKSEVRSQKSEVENKNTGSRGTLPRPKIVVAIDGPAGSGKSTIARRLAEKLGFEYLDTGAMYRALTWKALKKGIDPLDENALSSLAEKSLIRLGKSKIFIDGADATRAIRTLEVTNNVSAVSSLTGVRRVMVEEQRALVEKEKDGVVVEGRDIGTVVFPQANLKIYLTATPHERAVRRQKDFSKMGRKISVASLEREIIKRDRLDSTRRDSPLTKAADAREIDTTGKTVKDVVHEILKLLPSKLSPSLDGSKERL